MLEVGSAVFSLQPARSSAGDQLSTLVARALSEVRGVIQGEVWNVQWQCHIQRSVCMQSAVRTHVKIMQSTCGLAAPAPAGPRPSTAAVSPDLRSPIVAWPWSADSYCQFTSLLWLTFTSAVTPYEWDGGEKLRHHVFRLFYRQLLFITIRFTKIYQITVNH